MNRHDDANQLLGEFPAKVLFPRVNGDRPPESLQYALVELVTYRVVVDIGDEQLPFDSVVPNHRRPVPPGNEIEFARPGDECVAIFRGELRPRFRIFEGLAPGVCE